jgi:hypothetical protein
LVTIAQTLIGTPEGGCDNAKKTDKADLLFATWLDPDTLEETCSIFKSNVDACFQDTVVIGCDPATNTATVKVYKKDETFVPAQDYKVPNLKLGNCSLGKHKKGRTSILVTETFPCNPPGGPSGYDPDTCSDQSDTNYCSDGYYCRYLRANGGSYECTAYASEGYGCGGRTFEGAGAECNPSEAYCFYSKSSKVADISGVCTAYIGDEKCTSNTNTNDECASNSWCDIYNGR